MQDKKIIVVPKGGLANRMRAIASGEALASRLERPMLVVWRRNFELNASFNSLFKEKDLPFKLVEVGSLNYHLYYEAPRKKNLYLSKLFTFLRGTKIINIEQNIPENKLFNEIKRQKEDVIINSGLLFFDFDPKSLSSIFTFADNVIDKGKQILQGQISQGALQIRRTDNAESIKNSPLKLFEDVINAGVAENPSVKYFLATDDQNTKVYLSEKYPSHIIYNPTQASRKTPEGMIDAAAELYIMSQCPVIYGSYWSSFSEIAAMYGNKRLIVVKN